MSKIKAYKFAILAAICWLFIQLGLPSFFESSTREAMKQELIIAYKATVEDEYNDLIQKYEKDKQVYDMSKAAYLSLCKEYEEYLLSYEEECAAYEASYAQEIAQYQEDYRQYSDAIASRQLAYNKAYEEAENQTLKAGIPFTVKVALKRNYNNSVGNEWSWGAEINDQNISSTKEITLKLGSTIKLYAQVVESDSVPDVGSATGHYKMEKKDFNSAFDLEQTVTVRENRGRYAGNTAGFTITYSFTPNSYTVVVDESKLPSIPSKPTTPTYNPPPKTKDEPIEPIKPVYPTRDDVTTQEPDLVNFTVSNSEILSHHKALKHYVTWSSLGLAILFLFEIKRGKRILHDAKVEKERMLHEAKIKRERESFFAKERLLPPQYTINIQTTWANEEEKRINYLFAEFLHKKNLATYTENHIHFLLKKLEEPYLAYNQDLEDEVYRLFDESMAERQQLQKDIDSHTDPLKQIYNSSVKTSNYPIFKVPFSKASTVPELKEFFEKSKVSFFEGDAGIVYVLNDQYILKYHITKHTFETLTYDILSLSITDGTKSVMQMPSPDKYDILNVSWLHMTKKGLPDKRYSDNPTTWTVYNGQIDYQIGSTKKSVNFGTQKRAYDVFNSMNDFISERSVKLTGKYPSCFSIRCEEIWPNTSYQPKVFLNDEEKIEN